MTTLTTNKLALIDLDGVVIDATARFARAEEIRLLHLSEAGDKTANERYWREALDPAYTHLDTLIPGADEHLASLRREGFRILYISSRPESMRDATLKWLYDHGLFDDQNLLVLKAASFQFQKTVIWYDWMADTFVHTFQSGHVVIVSNKQANIDAMKRPIAGLQPRAYHRLADIFDPAHGADDLDDPFVPDSIHLLDFSSGESTPRSLSIDGKIIWRHVLRK